MKWLFDADGPFISGLSRIFDVMFLAILTMICSLPIVTVGAAVSAMYDIMIKMVLDRDHGVFKPYFKAFAKNFKKGTLIWLICLVGIAFVGANYYLLSLEFEGITQGVRSVVLILVFILTILLSFVLIYAFPLQARYENKVGTTLKNALFISIVQLPRSLGLLFANAVIIGLGIFVPDVIPMLVFVEFAVVGYITTCNMVKVFVALGDADAKKRKPSEYDDDVKSPEDETVADASGSVKEIVEDDAVSEKNMKSKEEDEDSPHTS